jgi:hypothetical protein
VVSPFADRAAAFFAAAFVVTDREVAFAVALATDFDAALAVDFAVFLVAGAAFVGLGMRGIPPETKGGGLYCPAARIATTPRPSAGT